MKTSTYLVALAVTLLLPALSNTALAHKVTYAAVSNNINKTAAPTAEMAPKPPFPRCKCPTCCFVS